MPRRQKNSGVYVTRINVARRNAIVLHYSCLHLFEPRRATRASRRLASRKTRLDRWNLNVTGDPRLLFTYVSITFASSGWLFRIVFARWRKSREAFNLTLFFSFFLSFVRSSQWNSIYLVRREKGWIRKIFCFEVYIKIKSY